MPRIIVLDTFPLSSTSKRESPADVAPTTLDQCHLWIKECIRAGNRIVAPAIAYYEVLRELERLNATIQIARLRAFCYSVPNRYLLLTDTHINQSAKLWGQARNAGMPTASPDALDCDVILAAQALSLGVPESDFIIATTNAAHLSRFVPADHWANITP